VVITDLLSILEHSSLFRLRYISAGAGGGNAYGLAAVCAVCYPFFFYGRIYYPGPPMKVIIFFITSILVSTFFHQKNTRLSIDFFRSSDIPTKTKTFQRLAVLVSAGKLHGDVSSSSQLA
jgi:hypothetical protein